MSNVGTGGAVCGAMSIFAENKVNVEIVKQISLSDTSTVI